jgi:hypothetical protein
VGFRAPEPSRPCALVKDCDAPASPATHHPVRDASDGRLEKEGDMAAARGVAAAGASRIGQRARILDQRSDPAACTPVSSAGAQRRS